MNTMRVQLTAQSIITCGNWDAFCELKGVHPHAMNEGLLGGGEWFTFTGEDIKTIGMCHYVKNRLSDN